MGKTPATSSSPTLKDGVKQTVKPGEVNVRTRAVTDAAPTLWNPFPARIICYVTTKH